MDCSNASPAGLIGLLTDPHRRFRGQLGGGCAVFAREPDLSATEPGECGRAADELWGAFDALRNAMSVALAIE